VEAGDGEIARVFELKADSIADCQRWMVMFSHELLSYEAPAAAALIVADEPIKPTPSSKRASVFKFWKPSNNPAASMMSTSYVLLHTQFLAELTCSCARVRVSSIDHHTLRRFFLIARSNAHVRCLSMPQKERHCRSVGSGHRQ
jgi:hypothetical protein